MSKLKRGAGSSSNGGAVAPPDPRAKLDALGIDWVCEQILESKSTIEIASMAGVGQSTVLRWLNSNEEWSARAKEARRQVSQVWDDMAEAELRAAQDPIALARARELASHFRWRAKIHAPREFGDKVTQEHVGAGGGPIQTAAVDLRGLSDEELAQANKLLSKAAAAAAKGADK